jgi:ubiquinone biosynthesis protein COQ9
MGLMNPPERSPERDTALDAMLPHVPDRGWTFAALRAGLAESGGDARDAELLFPAGPPDMIEAFCDLADRRMEQDAAEAGIAALRVSQRVRAIVALRLRQAAPHREAIRRALALLSLPRHAGVAARTVARTTDSIWHAAGDRSADLSWYSKRAILAAVYGATLLFWLRDTSEGDAETLAFLDRRLAGVARLGRLRRARPA